MTPAEAAAEVLRRITEHPETLNQATWMSNDWGRILPSSTDAGEWAECGTTACVAGHAAALLAAQENRYVMAFEIARAGAAVLGLGTDAANWLFDSRRQKAEVTTALRWLSEQRTAAVDAERMIAVSARSPQSGVSCDP